MVKKFGMDKCCGRRNGIKNYFTEYLKQYEYANRVKVQDDYEKAFYVISPLSNDIINSENYHKISMKE